MPTDNTTTAPKMGNIATLFHVRHANNLTTFQAAVGRAIHVAPMLVALDHQGAIPEQMREAIVPGGEKYFMGE